MALVISGEDRWRRSFDDEPLDTPRIETDLANPGAPEVPSNATESKELRRVAFEPLPGKWS